jgi:hypothetical protein
LQSTLVLSTYAVATQTIHPLDLYNLQRVSYGSNPPPIIYNSASPSPSSVPGNPRYYGWPSDVPHAKRDALPTPPPELLKRAGTTLPTYIATTYPPSRLSSACSCLSVPASTTTTISTYFYTQETVSRPPHIHHTLTLTDNNLHHLLRPTHNRLPRLLRPLPPSQCRLASFPFWLPRRPLLLLSLKNGLLRLLRLRLQLRMVEIQLRDSRKWLGVWNMSLRLLYRHSKRYGIRGKSASNMSKWGHAGVAVWDDAEWVRGGE